MAKTAKKKNTTNKKSKPKKHKRSIVGIILKWTLVLGLWGVIALSIVLAWYGQDVPKLANSINFAREHSITVKAADGTIIARYGDIKGDTVSVNDMPEHLIQAVLAIEDRRFYTHFGIDLIGLARAMVVNAQAKRFVQGGSTITQQLAKNLFLSRERTIKRKIQEALLALWLEHELNKDEILGAYLNRVYFGAGTYGVDAASQVYFGKSVQDINLQEAAQLAGLLKAPSRFSPLHNPGLSRQRARVVLNAMVDAGYIDETNGQKKIKGLPPPPPVKPGAPKGNDKYFADWVVDNLDELIGTPTEDIIVETTLNMKIQTTVRQVLTQTLIKHGAEHHISQGSVIVMRPDGAVVAMSGGKDYSQSQFNRAVQAKRQAGSAFKPIVYLSALEYGWTPETLVMDEPIETGRYKPKNFGNQYYGEVDLSYALTMSLNTVAVNLMRTLDRDPVIEMAQRLGITSNIKNDLSTALGTTSVSPLELAGVYSTIASGGIKATPYAVTRITSSDGELYYKKPRYTQSIRIVDPQPVYHLTQMMRRVIEEGTGRGAALSVPAAGKTGTSQNSRDAWFAGFTDELTGVVWLGNDDNTPMKNVTGGKFPAQIWRQIMSASRHKYPALANSYLYEQNVENSAQFSTFLNRLLSKGPRTHQNNPNRHTNNATGNDHDPSQNRRHIGHKNNERYND